MKGPLKGSRRASWRTGHLTARQKVRRIWIFVAEVGDEGKVNREPRNTVSKNEDIILLLRDAGSRN